MSDNPQTDLVETLSALDRDLEQISERLAKIERLLGQEEAAADADDPVERLVKRIDRMEWTLQQIARALGLKGPLDQD